MNSMLDAYQMSNILQVGCTFPHCNATQVVEMAAYQVSFFRTISGIATLKKEGNGAFLDNCVVHCGEQDCAGFNGFAVAGPSGNAVLMEVIAPLRPPPPPPPPRVVPSLPGAPFPFGGSCACRMRLTK